MLPSPTTNNQYLYLPHPLRLYRTLSPFIPLPLSKERGKEVFEGAKPLQTTTDKYLATVAAYDRSIKFP
jgi:hypothetical protein